MTVEDWRNPIRLVDGTKARQRPREEKGDGWQYQEWHRELRKNFGVHALAADVDLIEWRSRNGVLVPVALTEITRVEKKYTRAGTLIEVPDNYRESVLERFDERDLQGHSSRTVAAALGIQAYVVNYWEDCSVFWVFNLTLGGGWRRFDPEGMAHFLRTREPIGELEIW